MLWVIIAAGIYQCAVTLNGKDNPKETAQLEKEEEGQNSEEVKLNEKTQTENQAANITETPAQTETLPFDRNIRVLIKTENFDDIFHKEIRLSGTEGLEIRLGSKSRIFSPNEECLITAESLAGNTLIIRSGSGGSENGNGSSENGGSENENGSSENSGSGNGRIRLLNVKRNGDAQYRGTIECYGTDSGIVIVNELTVEEYLYGVVPSEMPSSYPIEAQKAQAIGARTYAYFHKRGYAYPQWRAHVDDSTTFQVYMNIPETDEAKNAVDATRDLVLLHDGTLIQSFYYSTSGGYSAGNGAWSEGVFTQSEDDYMLETGEDIFAENSSESEQKYKEYIDSGNPEDIEYSEPWYRWEYIKNFDADTVKQLFSRLYSMYQSQPCNVRIRSKLLGADKLAEETQINDIRVLTRQKSGLVSSLIIETPNFTVNVRTQNSIRQALAFTGDIVIKNDGNAFTVGNILPSAYFYIEKSFNKSAEKGNNLKGIVIRGAGLGHGAGMSQNGAKCLAQKGFTAEQILAYYYKSSIEAISDGSF